MSNILAITGRPNVGKSTLFNRLVERKQAIADNESGVTRDRHYGFAQWNGKYFTVIDTGGYVTGSNDIFEQAIRDQVKLALNEASVILFLVSCHEGMTDLDKDFANILRELNKPVLIVANKADHMEWRMMSAEFYALGLSSEVYAIVANSGAGTGELLDEVVRHFDHHEENPETQLPRIAILGRPNAGKSSFLNALLGTYRAIVTDVAGTTRDVIDTRYKMYGKDFMLTDTAGIRKKSKVQEDIEFYAVLRAIKALQNSDVCLVMLDAQRGFEAQDMNIITLADKYKKGIVIMVNKWDLVTEKDNHTTEKFRRQIQEKLGNPLAYMPILFTSVIEKQRIFQSIETAIAVYENRRRKISTSALNQALLSEIERYPPPALKGKHIKIKYITQLPTATPAFAFFCNLPQYIKAPYQRFLANKLRTHFDLRGTPIQVYFRKK